MDNLLRKSFFWFGILIFSCFGTYSFLCHSNNEMVYVQGGKFDMGWKKGRDDTVRGFSRPCTNCIDTVFEIFLCDYYIGRYEVSQEEWIQIMGDNPSEFSDYSNDHPVENINWFSSIIYCNERSRKEGYEFCYYFDSTYSKPILAQDLYALGTGELVEGRVIDVYWSVESNGYRLPTEAEWEYAARGGQKSKDLPSSEQIKWFEVSWGPGNSGKRTHSRRETKNVLKSNVLGLFNMFGNVSEYCWLNNSGFHSSEVCDNFVYIRDTQESEYLNTNYYSRGGHYRYSVQITMRWRKTNPEFARGTTTGFRLARSMR